MTDIKDKNMDNPINLFKTSKGQSQYFAAYDAALGLWLIPHVTTQLEDKGKH